MVNTVGNRLWNKLSFLSILTNAVEHHDCVVERISNQCQERCNDYLADFKIADEHSLSEVGRYDIGTGGNRAERNAYIVDQCRNRCNTVSYIAEPDPDVSYDSQQ